VVTQPAEGQAKLTGLRLIQSSWPTIWRPVLDAEIDSVLGNFPGMKPVDAALKHTLELA